MVVDDQNPVGHVVLNSGEPVNTLEYGYPHSCGRYDPTRGTAPGDARARAEAIGSSGLRVAGSSR
jgi:hypothetical protein